MKEPKRQFNVRIPEDRIDRLQKMAERVGMTIPLFVRFKILEMLETE